MALFLFMEIAELFNRLLPEIAMLFISCSALSATIARSLPGNLIAKAAHEDVVVLHRSPVIPRPVYATLDLTSRFPLLIVF